MDTEKIARLVPPRLKDDIVFAEQRFRGGDCYVLKNKLSESFFRLSREEAKIALWFDGRTSLGDLRERVAQAFPHLGVELEDLLQFYQRLSSSNLLNEQGDSFVRRRDSLKKMKSSAIGVWGQALSKLIFIKVPLLNPNRWIGRFAPIWKALYSRVGLFCAVCLWGYALYGLFLHFSGAPDPRLAFLDGFSFPLIWLALIFSKTLHEIGHAATCKAYGGNMNEMGICLICMAPCGYVDASDAWLIRDRRKRIAISAAGIYTELLIAGVAAVLWLHLSDGVFRAFLLNLMLVASVSTLLFNLNPLMKFDGYFLAVDLLGIPNLRTKAFRYFGSWFNRLVFGLPMPPTEPEEGRVFLAYTLAATAYMGFIVFSLGFFFLDILSPIGLKSVALFLGGFVFVSLLGMPIVKTMAGLKQRKNINKAAAYRRGGVVLVLVVAGVWALSLIPTRFVVRTQGVVEAAEVFEANAPVDGMVETLAVEPGQRVSAGDLLFAMEEDLPRMELERKEAILEREELSVRRLLFDPGLSSDREARVRERSVEEIGSVLAQDRENLRQMTIEAPFEGVVVPVPGVPLDRMRGRGVQLGTPLLRIDREGGWRVVAAVGERDARVFSVGDHASARIYASGRKVDLTVASISSRPGRPDELHAAHLLPNGGSVPLLQGQNRPSPETLEDFPVVLVEFRFEDSAEDADDLFVPGQRVRLEIHGGAATWGERVARLVRNFWDRRVG